MKTIREKQWELRENEILDTAYQLLLEQGYQKMNMDDLATRVGIAKMTIYQHFASKEILVVSIIVRGMRIIEEELLTVFTSTRPALERLEEILIKSFERRSSMRKVNLEIAATIVLQNPAYQAQLKRLSTQWTQLIEQAKAEGSIDPSLSTPILIRMLFQAIQTDYDDLLKEGVITVEELTHTLLSMALKGMRA